MAAAAERECSQRLRHEALLSRRLSEETRLRVELRHLWREPAEGELDDVLVVV